MDESIPKSMQQPLAINPLLQRTRIPGETFALPSGGLFYTHGELSDNVQNGEVHVYPMTGIDELVMKSVDKIFSGEAIKEVFGRCIPDVLEPGKLSAKDVDFLLVALRKVSYGATFEITYQHDCEDSKEHGYEIPLDPFLRSAKKINPTTVRTTFTHTLSNGQVIYMKPAAYEDVVKVYQLQQAQFTGAANGLSDHELLRTLLTSISVLIEKVDEVTDRLMILEWLESIPVTWLREISEAVKDTTEWGVNFEVEVQCRDCGEKLTIPTPLNPISFFI